MLLMLASLVMTGCGRDSERQSSQGASFRWSSFPVPLEVESSIYNDSQMMRDLADAIDFWNLQAGKTLFQLNGMYPAGQSPFTGPASDPDQITANVIFFQNPWPFNANVAGQSIVHAEQNVTQHAIMMLNPGTSLCSGNCNGQGAATSQRKLFAHELGHFLGFAHSENEKDIMFPEIRPGGSLRDVEVNPGILVQLVN